MNSIIAAVPSGRETEDGDQQDVVVAQRTSETGTIEVVEHDNREQHVVAQPANESTAKSAAFLEHVDLDAEQHALHHADERYRKSERSREAIEQPSDIATGTAVVFSAGSTGHHCGDERVHGGHVDAAAREGHEGVEIRLEANHPAGTG